jgi:glutamine cyclotransferase
MVMGEDIVSLKDQLLNPKRGDDFNTHFYLDGWRYCNVKIGTKICKVKPTAGGSSISYTITKMKEELKKTYQAGLKYL